MQYLPFFGLTAAEKRVAGHVANGLQRAEIAQAAGVTSNTVRTQLDAVYAKAGINSQRELQKLLRDLTPNVRKK